MPAKVYLTRRNLLTLLSKLARKGNGENTACTIVKADNLHEKYPQTLKKLSIVAVEYGSNFTGQTLYIDRGLLRGLLLDLDQKKTGAACVAVIKEAHPKRSPKSIEVFALENKAYYTGRRFPGDVCPADDPDLQRGDEWQ
jgi:hypothetical protein